MLERKKYFASCKVLKDCKYETWPKDLKMVELRGRVFMFRRGEGPKNYKGYIYRMKIKEIKINYLREVSDI